MSNPRFELTGDQVDIVEDVWNVEDTRHDEERAPVFTFAAETRPEARGKILALLNRHIGEFAPSRGTPRAS